MDKDFYSQIVQITLTNFSENANIKHHYFKPLNDPLRLDDEKEKEEKECTTLLWHLSSAPSPT